MVEVTVLCWHCGMFLPLDQRIKDLLKNGVVVDFHVDCWLERRSQEVVQSWGRPKRSE